MLKASYNKLHGLVRRRSATSPDLNGDDHQVADEPSDMDTLGEPTASHCDCCRFDIAPGAGILVKHCKSLLCRFCVRKALQEAVDRGKFHEVRCPMQQNGVICNEVIAEDEVNAALCDEVVSQVSSVEGIESDGTVNQTALDIGSLPATLNPCDVLIEFNGIEETCLKCKINLEKGTGVVLQRCRHVFCRTCISGAIQNRGGYSVKCPTDCAHLLMDNEIRIIMESGLTEQNMNGSLARTENTRDHPCRIESCDGVCEKLDGLTPITQCLLCNTLQCSDCQSSAATVVILNLQYEQQLEDLRKQLESQIELSKILLEEMLSQNKYGEDIKQWKEDFESRDEQQPDSPVTPSDPKPAHLVLLEKLNNKDVVIQGLMIVGIGISAVFIGYSSFTFIRWAWPVLETVATRLATAGATEMMYTFVSSATFTLLVERLRSGEPLDSNFFKTAGAEILKLITHFAPMFLKRNPAIRA